MIQGGAVPSSPWEMVATSSLETKIVLLVLAALSLLAWFIIAAKVWQFRRLRLAGQTFFRAVAHATRLDDAWTWNEQSIAVEASMSRVNHGFAQP